MLDPRVERQLKKIIKSEKADKNVIGIFHVTHEKHPSLLILTNNKHTLRDERILTIEKSHIYYIKYPYSHIKHLLAKEKKEKKYVLTKKIAAAETAYKKSLRILFLKRTAILILKKAVTKQHKH